MFKHIILSLIFAASLARAGVVTMTDGSSLSGELTDQADGSVKVKTAAGEITVAKDKIRSVIKDSAQSAPGGESQYVKDVKARREKYGNEDGIPRGSLVLSRQVAFTVGQLNYIGDALNIKDPSSGLLLATTSEFSGLHYGLSLDSSFNDISGWEIWGGYSQGEKGFSWAGSSAKVNAQRVDAAFGIKVQKAMALGEVEQNFHFIPSLGLGPVFSYTTVGTYAASGSTLVARQVSSSAIGLALTLGGDLQFGSALIGAKVRYLMSSDVSGGLNSSNLSALLPQLSVGLAF
jgi:hypothetical protein